MANRHDDRTRRGRKRRRALIPAAAPGVAVDEAAIAGGWLLVDLARVEPGGPPGARWPALALGEAALFAQAQAKPGYPPLLTASDGGIEIVGARPATGTADDAPAGTGDEPVSAPAEAVRLLKGMAAEMARSTPGGDGPVRDARPSEEPLREPAHAEPAPAAEPARHEPVRAIPADRIVRLRHPGRFSAQAEPGVPGLPKIVRWAPLSPAAQEDAGEAAGQPTCEHQASHRAVDLAPALADDAPPAAARRRTWAAVLVALVGLGGMAWLGARVAGVDVSHLRAELNRPATAY